MSILSTTSNKKRSKNLLIVILVVILVTLTNIFVTAKYIIPKTESESLQLYLKNNTKSVVVVNADLPTGSDINGSTQTISLPKDIIPSNAITSDVDLTKLVAKINLAKNTVLTTDMLVNPNLDEKIDNSTRIVEVSYVENGQNVQVGDYIDIRFRSFSTNVDGSKSDSYSDSVVVAKKEVIDKVDSTLYLKLSESDILNLGTAAADAVITQGYASNSQLYVTEYVDPYNQEKATVTYSNPSLTQQIIDNPKIADDAINKLSGNHKK